MNSVEFRREPIIEAAALLFEVGLSACYVPEQRVQLLWTQYQQSLRQYEQDFRTKTRDSPFS